MLAPDNRALLLDALRPPADHVLDHAVSTTFTLDLETALMVPLAFAGFQFDEHFDPIEVMESLRRMGERVDVFYQAGAISAGRWPSDLLAMMEDVLHGVRRPRPSHIFHPKVWVLRFLDMSGEAFYRLIVLSRNLTSDRSWDTVLWMDGRPEDRPITSNALLSRFLGALTGLTVTQLPSARSARLAELAEELNQVRWDLPDGVREVRFHPIGLPDSPPFPIEEHFSGYRKLAMSPYVRDGAIRRILRVKGGEKAVLVSRGEELARLQPDSIDDIEVYELDPVAALSLVDEQGSAHAYPMHLHAKVFAVERARLAHLFVGSANATEAGFSGGNVEFLCELVGQVAKFGIDALVGEDSPFRKMLTPYVASESPDSDETATAIRGLDDLLIDVAGEVPFRTGVTQMPDGWMARVVSETALPCFPEGTNVTLAAHNRPNETFSLRPFEYVDVELQPRELADITPFLELRARQRVDGQQIERSAVICSHLEGAPDDRFEEIMARQIDTPEKFMRLLLLLIGSGSVRSGDAAAEGGGLSTWSGGSSHGFLELLAQALAERPSSIDHLEAIVDRLRLRTEGDGVLPQGWDDVWLPVLKARRAMSEGDT